MADDDADPMVAPSLKHDFLGSIVGNRKSKMRLQRRQVNNKSDVHVAIPFLQNDIE
jgi:hypothetical protein